MDLPAIQALYWAIVIVGVALAVAWIVLPFVVWSLRDTTQEMLTEIKRLNTIMVGFRSDFRTAADKALAEKEKAQEGGPAHL